MKSTERSHGSTTSNTTSSAVQKKQLNLLDDKVTKKNYESMLTVNL